MQPRDVPPALSIVGRKNSGKTTLVVALAAELKRRGYRVASVKHGHHAFEIDRPGRDTWRHFHEGEVEAVLMVSGPRVALVMRTAEEAEPRRLIADVYGGRGYDVVLVEGYKRGPFPKVEIHRAGVHERPIFDASDDEAAGHYLALVTDAPGTAAPFPVLPLDPADPAGGHVGAVADLVERWLAGRPDAAD